MSVMWIWGAAWGAVIVAFVVDTSLFWLGAVAGALTGHAITRSIRREVQRQLATQGEHTPSASRSDPATAEPATPPAAAVAPDVPDSLWPEWSEDSAEDTLPPATAAPGKSPLPAAAPPKTARPRPASTARPDPEAPSRLPQGLQDWLLGGNTLARVGLLILFVGLSFLVRYAAHAGLFPIELRLAAVGAAGLVLLLIGFRLRERRRGFGLSLQGGGGAVLYLTLFGAYRLYGLMPQGSSLAFMVLVCAGICALALLQDARALAFTAFAGGFAAPLLLSDGGGSHIVLFSYYAVLNLAILAIAARRNWRELNILAMLATYGAAALWGVLSYSPEHYASSQGFLLLFLAIYIAMALLHAWHGMRGRAAQVTSHSMIFGAPLMGFGLQLGLVHDWPMGPAWAALGFGLLYVLLAAALLRSRADGRWRQPAECFVALALGFITLAIPLAAGARWTSAAWALEGLAAGWIGLRQRRWMLRAFGLAMQILALAAWLNGPGGAALHSLWAVRNADSLGAWLMAMTAGALACFMRQAGGTPARGTLGMHWQAMETGLAPLTMLYAALLATVGWATLVLQYTQLGLHAAWQLITLGVGVMALLSRLLARRLQWPQAGWFSLGLLPVMGLSLVLEWMGWQHAVKDLGWITWPALLLLFYSGLWLQDRLRPEGQPPSGRWQHVLAVWLVLALLADALWVVLEHYELLWTGWASASGLLVAAAVLLALSRLAGPAAAGAPARWPVQQRALDYLWTAALPVVALLALACAWNAWMASGSAAPLPWLPLLNPVELTLWLALGSMLLWRRAVLAAKPFPRTATWLQSPVFWALVSLLAFSIVSGSWLRVAHHWLHIPWRWSTLWASFAVQAGYSILWTLLALALMVAAHRRALRPAWLAGAGLLVLVVAKLLLYDLANTDGMARIIAFIAVGVLMLLIGYLAPLPPAHQVPDSRSPHP